MTQDRSYQPGIYRTQGGNELVVGSSGLITVETGGAIVVADGGQIANPVTTQATTSGTITNHGITTFGTTKQDAYVLADPSRAGLRKSLICTVHGATTITATVTTASTVCTIVGSTVALGGILRTLTFLSAGGAVELVSLSTAAWAIVGNTAANGAVALTS